MEVQLLNILACPLCKGKLIYDHHGAELICKTDKLAYPLNNGIPVMLPNLARELIDEEF